MITKRLGALALFIAVFTSAKAQLDNFTATLNSFFSEPEENGFMYFQTPNTYPVGACFQYYKGAHSDLDNDMILINTYHDDVMNMDHYKFQQVFKGVPVEGAGCIEHYDASGSLVFTNAKHAVNLNIDISPKIEPNMAMDVFLMNADTLNWAWLDSTAEANIKDEANDPNASYLPEANLILALDELSNLGFNIDGSRYRLAYEITAYSLVPDQLKSYFMDANTGEIFRVLDKMHTDGPAFVENYGIRIIDSRWRGGVYQDYILESNDNGRHIHTKKKESPYVSFNWGVTNEVVDDNDQWPTTKYVETSTHYFTQVTWDYFKNTWNWEGLDNLGSEVRVRTHLYENNAYYKRPFGNSTYSYLHFGSSPVYGDHYGTDPSVVAHEYIHGITTFTADLDYQNESGALNESFSDILGIVVQAKMLDNNFTDWTIGNFVQNGWTRSLENPKLNGFHYDQNGQSVLGQPDTYLGDFYYTGNDDNGGIHINSGVQNKWFQLLAEGGSGTNDNSDIYQVDGIGLTSAAEIAFISLTTSMLNSAQFIDSRMASITIAKLLFGECSIEHQSTENAWFAVGVGPATTCTYTLDNSEIINLNESFNVFPNPASNQIHISLPILDSPSLIIVNDMSGKLLFETNTNNPNLMIDVSNFESGVYLVTYLNEKVTGTKKFIKK